MVYKLAHVLLLLGMISQTAFAQTTLPVPRSMQKAYDIGTRNTDGTPGPRYWQNTARYTIQATFVPQTRLLSGTEEITYVNNSPDTLTTIWFKLYPNFYQRGAARDISIKPQDLTDGVHIGELFIDGVAENPGEANIQGTNMTLPVRPLLPHQQLHFTIKWSYTLNKTSHLRTGQVAQGAYFIAYFFPRIAVYDDIDGWNQHGYTGTPELYNDFCDFDVSITVPEKYLVWATGSLNNAKGVLADKFVKRLQEAELQDQVTTIIDTTDLKEGHITTEHPTNTWHYAAKNVTDFVFATSDHYVWKASSLVVDQKTSRRTRVDAAFDPAHRDFEEVVHFARKTIEAMSDSFPAWPYPYPHETVFDGLDQMEYPMMVNDNPLADRTATIELTDHEIFHTMFPFYMGTNETKYAFMDEGWATMGEWLISPMIDSTLIDPYGMDSYDLYAGTEEDLPIIIPSVHQSEKSYYLNAYPKPALGYLYVRDLLGTNVFTKALHHYIATWHGKHPMPLDFFNSMNQGSGKNLNWFWKNWFYDTGYPDLAIENVSRKGSQYLILVISKGHKAVPVVLTVTFTDGSTQKMYRSVAVWKDGAKHISLKLPTTKIIKKVTLGSTYGADTDETNNTHEVK